MKSASLSIGRGADNDWVLPDPERIISKTHCVISAENGRFILTDLSSNGLYMNGSRQATSRDSRIVLSDGDQFRLGDYVISVAEVNDEPASGSGRNEVINRPVREVDPFGSEPPAGGSAHDPLDFDPLDQPFVRGSDVSFQHPFAHVPSSLRAEDPFDLSGKRSGRKIEPDDDLFRGIAPATNWQGAPRPDHAPAPSQVIPPPRVIPTPPPGEIDFDALLGDLVPQAGSPASRASIPSPASWASDPSPASRASDPSPASRASDPSPASRALDSSPASRALELIAWSGGCGVASNSTVVPGYQPGVQTARPRPA